MSPWVPIVVGLLAAIVGPTGAWLVARRTTSSDVTIAREEMVLSEGQAMRHELRAELVETRARFGDVCDQLEAMTVKLAELATINRELRDRVSELLAEMAALRTQVRGQA